MADEPIYKPTITFEDVENRYAYILAKVAQSVVAGNNNVIDLREGNMTELQTDLIANQVMFDAFNVPIVLLSIQAGALLAAAKIKSTKKYKQVMYLLRGVPCIVRDDGQSTQLLLIRQSEWAFQGQPSE